MMLLAVGSTFIVLIFNSDWNNHFIVRICYLIFMVLLGIEMHYFLPSTMRPYNVLISIFATILHPLYVFIHTYTPHILTIQNMLITPNHIIVIALVLYSTRALGTHWRTLLNEITGFCFLLIYPGLLSSYFQLVIGFEHTTLHLYTLVGTVYMNDGFAYLGGIAFGRKKKKSDAPLIAVSPSKTLIGYCFGFTFGFIMFVIMYIIDSSLWEHNILKTAIFALLVNIAATLGDLLESALKRILNKKDSGTLMPGRGGILDSFDSLLTAAPIYYILYLLMF